MTGSLHHILIVDDEPGVSHLCQRLLDRAGFRAKTVSCPQRALELLDMQNFGLLLVDIRLPGINGWQLMEQAREIQPDLSIVVMSDYGTIETAISALRRGADGLVLKPFADGEELVKTVRKVLRENARKRDLLMMQALRPLFQLSERLFSENDPGRLRSLILDVVCDHFICEHAALYQQSSHADRMERTGWRGDPPHCEAITQLLGLELNGIGTDPIHLNCTRQGDRISDEILAAHGLESLICIPVILEKGRYYFVAARDAGNPPFLKNDREFFMILARQAGIALENARLYSELRKYTRQIEEAQHSMIKAEKMATAGRLTASIAHEINNPLQAVQNCLHLAKRQELSSEQRQDYLEIAQYEMNRLMSTVERMLQLYRQGTPDRRPADLNALIRRVILLMNKHIETQQIHVRTCLAPDLPPINVVNDQIQQVLLNLILNALQAMPEGGELLLESRAHGREVHLTIADTGPGVPEHHREWIFEPFTSTKDEGTGLGLPVSYGIITAHGGQLELAPDVQRGACFRIMLPIGE
jgi:two-component system, NtrC family, sensor kinase